MRAPQLFGVLLILAALSAPAGVAAQSTAMGPPPGVIILEAEVPRGSLAVRYPAEQLRQMLTVRLVNRGTYRVISPFAVEALLENTSRTPADLKDPAVLTELARALDADYILASGLSIVMGAGNWSITLMNAHNQQTVWSTILPVSTERPMVAVRIAAEQLETFGRDVRLVQLNDIQLLLEAGELDRAQVLYDRYRETRSATDESRQVGARIELLRAEKHYHTARRYADLWLFEDALVELNRAITLQPENPEYIAYITELRQRQRVAQDARRSEQIAVATALVAEGYYQSAQLLLDTLIAEELAARTVTTPSPELAALQAQLDENIGARNDYEAALSAYWSGDYPTARARVRSAINRSPQRPEYGRLLEQIDGTAREQEVSDIVWQGYRTRLAAWSLKKALTGPVEITPSWEGSIGSGSYTFRNQDTLSQTEISQTVFRGAYRRPWLLPLAQQSPMLSLHGGWHADATLRGGSEEKTTASGLGDDSKRLYRATYQALGVAGGGFLTARLFGFSTETGLELDNHLLFVTTLERDPAADTDKQQTVAAWVPSLNWFLGLAWHVDEKSRFTLRYTTSLAAAVIPAVDSDMEDYRPSSFTVGYGRSLR